MGGNRRLGSGEVIVVGKTGAHVHLGSKHAPGCLVEQPFVAVGFFSIVTGGFRRCAGSAQSVHWSQWLQGRTARRGHNGLIHLIDPLGRCENFLRTFACTPTNRKLIVRYIEFMSHTHIEKREWRRTSATDSSRMLIAARGITFASQLRRYMHRSPKWVLLETFVMRFALFRHAPNTRRFWPRKPRHHRSRFGA